VVAVGLRTIGGCEYIVCCDESGLMTALSPKDGKLLPSFRKESGRRAQKLFTVQALEVLYFVDVWKHEFEVWSPKTPCSVRGSSEESISADAGMIDGEPVVVLGHKHGNISVHRAKGGILKASDFLAHTHRSFNQADDRIYRSNVGTVTLLDWGGELRILSSGWEDHQLKSWKLDGDQLPVHPLPSKWTTFITAAAVNRMDKTRFLAIGDMYGVCTIWNLQRLSAPPIVISNKIDSEATLDTSNANWARAVQFKTIEGRETVTVAYRDGTIGVYDASDGVALAVAKTGSLVSSSGLVVTSQGLIVVAGFRGMTALQLRTSWLEH
jgi:WD40 repeat protein